jgi:putative transcriptional regulator
MTYHYKESGLDNIYLENGFTIHNTAYGEGISIEDVEGLHRAIGEWIIETPKPVNGAELRFIRTEMELTQRDLAAILGTSEQTLRLWERGRNKAMPGPADRLLRAVYSEYIGGDGSLRELVDRLAELDQIQHTRACLRETEDGWRIAA